jgi:ABC-type sugar transport system substrate-binding protein
VKNKEDIQTIAIDGAKGTAASNDRMIGLYKTISKYKNLTLEASSEGYWNTESTQKATSMLLKRTNPPHIIWAANDNSAIGAVHAAKKAGLTPGKDIFIGGIDWIPDIFEYIRRDEVAVSIGGHFLEGMWAVILAYDYKNGHDFADNDNKATLLTPMNIIDKNNITEIAPIIENVQWDTLNFKALSKTHNKDIEVYDFDLIKTLNTHK